MAKRAFIDPITNRKVDAGQIYTVTRDQIDNGIYSELPLTFVSLYSAEKTANSKLIVATNKRIAEQADRLRAANVIDYKESDKIKKSLSQAKEDFVHASGGRSLVEGIILKIAKDPEDIVGGEASVKQIWGDVKNIFGKPDKKYNDLKAFQSDLKIAFQKVIPVALRNIQSGNSISDNDVRNLAQAFIAGGLINQDESTGLITLNVDLSKMSAPILVKRLQEMNGMFKTAQENSLITFDQEIYNLKGAENTGRYDMGYFRPQLEAMTPAFEMYRARQGKGKTTGSGTVIKVMDYFNLTPEGAKQIQALPKR